MQRTAHSFDLSTLQPTQFLQGNCIGGSNLELAPLGDLKTIPSGVRHASIGLKHGIVVPL